MDDERELDREGVDDKDDDSDQDDEREPVKDRVNDDDAVREEFVEIFVIPVLPTTASTKAGSTRIAIKNMTVKADRSATSSHLPVMVNKKLIPQRKNFKGNIKHKCAAPVQRHYAPHGN